MKKKLILALVSTALLLAYPAGGYAWPQGRGGYYQPAPRVTHHHSHSGGSDVVPYLLGGLLVGGILGAVLSRPSYPAPAPAPTYTYSAPSYGGQEPPGQWVTVPGRWVNGRWVPAHDVWAPINP
ncbi:MAG TPA: hypothetical protein DCR97_15135 [Deltaproteobacteria bacterium]|jgi:hypothetical protein|nr:hypothetical protein [Deltaproteobacteria bacterium]